MQFFFRFRCLSAEHNSQSLSVSAPEVWTSSHLPPNSLWCDGRALLWTHSHLQATLCTLLFLLGEDWNIWVKLRVSRHTVERRSFQPQANNNPLTHISGQGFYAAPCTRTHLCFSQAFIEIRSLSWSPAKNGLKGFLKSHRRQLLIWLIDSVSYFAPSVMARQHVEPASLWHFVFCDW